MNLPFFIAKRYLLSKKSQNAINIISGISVLGICVGTMALVVVLSAFNGVSDLVKTLYKSFGADLAITTKEGKIFVLDTATIEQVKKIEGVVYYTEVLEDNAMLRYEDRQCFATVRGVSKDFLPMSRFDTLVVSGAFLLESKDAHHVVLGKGVSYRLNAGAGNYFSSTAIYAPKRGADNPVNPEESFNSTLAYVSAEYSINEEFDNKYALVSIEHARELFGYSNEVSSIELGLAPNASEQKVRAALVSLLGDSFVIKNQHQQNALLFKTLQSEKLWTFIILAFILIVATFNVIGSLTMLIIEKKNDIKILSNMGADIHLIRTIFLWEGLMVTLTGALAGLLIGTFICYGQQRFSWITFNENFVVSAYPVKMILTDYVAVLALVFFIGLLAAWYPVRVFTKRHLTVG